LPAPVPDFSRWVSFPCFSFLKCDRIHKKTVRIYIDKMFFMIYYIINKTKNQVSEEDYAN